MIGDFNTQPSDTSANDFCDICSFKYLLKEPICYENLINPKCIDLTQRSLKVFCY